jgi:hypothetical protein
MENIVLQKSLRCWTNQRKHSEEHDTDETFGMHFAHSMKQVDDQCMKELLKLKIQQLLVKGEFSRQDQLQSTSCQSWASESQRLML